MDSSFLDKKYFVRDLTAVGKVNTGISDLISEKQVMRFNPERYNFYMQLLKGLMNPDTKEVVDTVLTLEADNRVRQEAIRDKAKEVADALTILSSKGNAGKIDDNSLKTINNSLDVNPIFKTGKKYQVEKSGGGNESSQSGGDGDSYFSGKLNKLGFIRNDKGIIEKKTETAPDPNVTTKERDVVKEYVSNIGMSPENEKITVTDRVVFIAVTYVIRGLSLFIMQWALNSYVVKTFKQAFMFYTFTYIGLFLLWVLLTNSADDVFLFNIIFYYISTTPHGYGRIIIHMVVYFLMLPILSIVDTSNSEDTETPYSFEESRRIYKQVSNISFFMWMFSVLISMSY